MAKFPQADTHPPYHNTAWKNLSNGISILQPTYQILPDQHCTNNPCFVPGENKSFWTYKVMQGCLEVKDTPVGLLIPIAETITDDLLTVRKKLDGMNMYEPVPFVLLNDTASFSPLPKGFRYIQLDLQNELFPGNSLFYQLEVLGSYLVAPQPIFVETEESGFLGSSDVFFQVPSAPSKEKLLIAQKTEHVVDKNTATLLYNVVVHNIGTSTAEDIKYEETVSLPPNFQYKEPLYSPSFLNTDISSPDKLIIIGNLGHLHPGEKITVQYEIPVVCEATPNKYIIQNMISVTSTNSSSRHSGMMNLDVVQLKAKTLCSLQENQVLKLQLRLCNIEDSPSTLVNIHKQLRIPPGIEVQFMDFGCFKAQYSVDNTSVPLNTTLTGPLDITLSCNRIPIGPRTTVQNTILLKIMNRSTVQKSTIQYILNSIISVHPHLQCLLPIDYLPLETEIGIE